MPSVIKPKKTRISGVSCRKVKTRGIAYSRVYYLTGRKGIIPACSKGREEGRRERGRERGKEEWKE